MAQMYRANDSFVVNVSNDADDPQEVFIAEGKAYSDATPRYKKIIDRFPDRFEAEEKAGSSR